MLPPPVSDTVTDENDENQMASITNKTVLSNSPTLLPENRTDRISLRYVGYSIIDVDGPFSEFVIACKEMIYRSFHPSPTPESTATSITDVPDVWNWDNGNVEVCCMKYPLKVIETYCFANGTDGDSDISVARVLGGDSVEGGDQMILQLSTEFLATVLSSRLIMESPLLDYSVPLQQQRFGCSDWLHYVVHRQYVLLK